MDPVQEIHLNLQDIDWSSVVGLELRGSRDVYKGAEYSHSIEDNFNPQYVSVFIKQKNQNVSWIGDEPNLASAKTFANSLGGIHHIPVKDYVRE